MGEKPEAQKIFFKLRFFSQEYFTDIAEQTLQEKGVQLFLRESITGFDGKDGKVTTVLTSQGRYDTDLVILCIGFKPNTGLFQGKLDMLSNGAIKVDEFMRTSRQDVLAAGDCCAVIFNPTAKHEYIPLATNAIRMGTLAARNLMKPTIKYLGTQGTSGIKIYDYHIASTGLTLERAMTTGL